MSQENLKTSPGGGLTMPSGNNNNYRRAFWIALATTSALLIVSSVLWWRLNNAGTSSRSNIGPAQQSPNEIVQTSQEGTDQKQSANMQETSLAAIQLTPQRMQSIG